MAKKKATAEKNGPQNKVEKPAKGYKQCPTCVANGNPSWVRGARTKVCPDCDHEFAGTTTTTKQKTKGQDVDKLAMEFVLFNQGGSLDKALKAVEGYSEDSLAQFIASCGGTEKAKEILKRLVAKQGAK